METLEASTPALLQLLEAADFCWLVGHIPQHPPSPECPRDHVRRKKVQLSLPAKPHTLQGPHLTMLCASNQEGDRGGELQKWESPAPPHPQALSGQPPPPRCPCRKGTRHFSGPVSWVQPFPPQRLGLESLIWEGRICFSIGPCERGQKQRAVLVSGQEVFAQPYRQML